MSPDTLVRPEGARESEAAAGGAAAVGGRPGRMVRAYTEAAIVLMNTVVFFVLLNLGLFAVFAVKDQWVLRELKRAEAAADPAARYGRDFMSTVYPGWSEGELDVLMAESWGRPYDFAPYTHFRERAVRGRYVNIDPAGFRRVRGQGAWPPREGSFNVFFFGGSTTFGYGLPDDQTIPSFVQELLAANPCGRPVSVYNFGVGFYFSTQERIAFEQLVASGRTPDLAVFVDGLNDFYHREDVPSFSDRLVAVMEGRPDPAAKEEPSRVPVVRAARYLVRRLAPNPAPAAAGAQLPDSVAAERVIRRWLANRSILEGVGKEFGVPLLFVWQPVPTYGYDLAYHPFSGGELAAFAEHRLSHVGYRMMAERAGDRRMADFLWLGDMQRGKREQLYVDMVHYTGAFSREIAGRIADRILADGAVCGGAERRGAL